MVTCYNFIFRKSEEFGKIIISEKRIKERSHYTHTTSYEHLVILVQLQEPELQLSLQQHF